MPFRHMRAQGLIITVEEKIDKRPKLASFRDAISGRQVTNERKATLLPQHLYSLSLSLERACTLAGMRVCMHA